ncbi:MAG: threonylcarbamoyl-AMP synthase [Candidatus Aminicenantes bacterium]|nr:threonylcarbamoyl-AMP synthase [Candidatus Aminicenantes bacterium]
MGIKTREFLVDTEKIKMDIIETIVPILEKDGIIAYPTETFYGLGGNIFSPEAVNKIYNIKGRDFSKPLSVVIADTDMIPLLASEIPGVLSEVASRFWPGPLTVVLKASAELPRRMTGPKGTIGIRLPASPWVRALVRRAGFPLTATSANLSGEKNPDDPESVRRDFWGKIDALVNGGRTPGGKPSTVLDLSLPDAPILREGAVPASDLAWLRKPRS